MARCIDAEAVDAGLIDEPQRPSLEISADGRVLRVEIGKPGEPAVLDALLVREVDRTEVVEPADEFIVGEPWMTVPKVVDHDIEHDLEALRVSRADELLQLGHVAEMGVDLVRIARPVAVIALAHLLRDRRDPDRGHPETFDVVELVDHALKVAALPPISLAGDAVEVVRRIAILETVGHHHVDGLVPPVGRRGGRPSRQEARDDDERREERVHAGTRTAASRAPTVIPPLTRFRVRRSTRLPSGRHTSVGKSPVLIATYMSSRGASGGASGLIDVRRYA